VIKKVIFLSCAAAALTLACPQTARAQMAGGSMGDDEKKDEAPATPKADDGAKPDAGKTDPAKPEDKPASTKTLVFDKIGADWKEAKHLAKNQRAHYKIGKGHDDSADVTVQVANPKQADWDKQLAFRCGLYQGTDGKKLDKSAAKCDSFEVAGLKVKTAEISGTFMGGGHPKKEANQDSADKPQGKPNQKTILAMIEGGPDGTYVASLYGPDKIVDGARDAFIAFLKSAKVADAKPAADEKKDDKGAAPANPGAPGAAPGAEK
jgi:hypothetical protein